MTGFDYARARGTAQRLIERFGQRATLRLPGAVTGPKHNPTVGAPTDMACVLAVTEYTNQDRANTLIKETDKRVYLSTAGLSVEPTTTMRLVIGGLEHIIVRVEPLSPAGTVVYWDCQARRS